MVDVLFSQTLNWNYTIVYNTHDWNTVYFVLGSMQNGTRTYRKCMLVVAVLVLATDSLITHQLLPCLVIAPQIIYKVRKGIDCDIGLQSFFISPANGDTCQSAEACPDVPANWGPIDSHSIAAYFPYTCCIDFSYPFFTGGWALMSKVGVAYVRVISVNQC